MRPDPWIGYIGCERAANVAANVHALHLQTSKIYDLAAMVIKHDYNINIPDFATFSVEQLYLG